MSDEALGSHSGFPELAEPVISAPVLSAPIRFGLDRRALPPAVEVARLRRSSEGLTLQIAVNGRAVAARDSWLSCAVCLSFAEPPALAPGEVLAYSLDAELLRFLGQDRLFPPKAEGGVSADLHLTLPRPGALEQPLCRVQGLGFDLSWPVRVAASPLAPSPALNGEPVSITPLRDVLKLLMEYADAESDGGIHSDIRVDATQTRAISSLAIRRVDGITVDAFAGRLTRYAARDLRALLRVFDPNATRAAPIEGRYVFAAPGCWCSVDFSPPGPATALTALVGPCVSVASDNLLEALQRILSLDHESDACVQVSLLVGPQAELAFALELPAGLARMRCPVTMEAAVSDSQATPPKLWISTQRLAKIAPALAVSTMQIVVGPIGLCVIETDGVCRVETYIPARKVLPQAGHKLGVANTVAHFPAAKAGPLPSP